jgi:hypothetical protein
VNGETKTEPRPRLRGTARTWPRPAPATVSTSPRRLGVRLTPMTHHRARPSGRRTDVKPPLPEWHRECSRAQAAAPVLAWRCPALRRGLCRPTTVLPSLDSASNGAQHCLVRPARMRAHRDEAQEAVMPGAGVLGFGGEAVMRVKLPLIVLAAVAAVLGSAPLAAAGDRPSTAGSLLGGSILRWVLSDTHQGGDHTGASQHRGFACSGRLVPA